MEENIVIKFEKYTHNRFFYLEHGDLDERVSSEVSGELLHLLRSTLAASRDESPHVDHAKAQQDAQASQNIIINYISRPAAYNFIWNSRICLKQAWERTSAQMSQSSSQSST